MGVSTHILLARRERERREREATRRAEAGEAAEPQEEAEPYEDADAMAEEAFAFEGEPLDECDCDTVPCRMGCNDGPGDED